MNYAATKDMSRSYAVSEWPLIVSQTAAVMEIVHAAVGLVRSGVSTTAMQVFSRIFLLWGVLILVPEVQTEMAVTSMLFAWSVTEVVRYSFYVANIVGFVPYPLLWCRYSFFYVL